MCSWMVFVVCAYIVLQRIFHLFCVFLKGSLVSILSFLNSHLLLPSFSFLLASLLAISGAILFPRALFYANFSIRMFGTGGWSWLREVSWVAWVITCISMGESHLVNARTYVHRCIWQTYFGGALCCSPGLGIPCPSSLFPWSWWALPVIAQHLVPRIWTESLSFLLLNFLPLIMISVFGLIQFLLCVNTVLLFAVVVLIHLSSGAYRMLRWIPRFVFVGTFLAISLQCSPSSPCFLSPLLPVTKSCFEIGRKSPFSLIPRFHVFFVPTF